MAINTGPMGPRTPGQDARQILAASAAAIGRFQAPELFYSQDVSLAAPVTLNIPRPLNLNRPAESLTIALRFRLAVSGAAYTSVAPEAPQSLLQGVTLNGTHREYGNLTPIRMSGATIFAWQQLFERTGADRIVNGVRSADLGRPIVSPLDNGSGVIAVGNYDCVVLYNIPFGPQMGIGQSTKRDLASYLYQPADWGDTLSLQLVIGDASAMGNPTGATVAFTAFGSGAGLPNVAVHVNYSILGPFANSLRTGVVIRQEQTLNSFVTAGNTLRLAQLQKQKTTNVVVKSGTTQAATSAGVNNFGTLSDTQLNRTQILVDNKPVKNNSDNLVQKQYLGRMFNTIIPGGYFMLSFVDGQNPQLAYRADGIAGGSLFELYSDVLTTGATQQQTITQEMIYGGPFPSLRPA